MFKGFFKKNTTRSLKDAVSETQEVIIDGVIFHIKRIDITDVLTGAKVLQKTYATFEEKRQDEKTSELDMGRVKQIYADVILAGVVKPKIVRKQNEDESATCIDEVLTNWPMASELYACITSFTNGKKKLNT